MQLPRLTDFDDSPRYNTLAVVRLTQVKAPRLRAWERRYAILSPQRGQNSYRLYSERDVAIVRWLRDQVDHGVTISQAIAMLRETERHAPPTPPAVDSPLRLGQADLARDLAEAGLRLDEQTATGVLRQSFAVYAVEDVCLNVITPALYSIGEYWAVAGQGIMQEHFLTAICRAGLEAIWQATNGATVGPLILVGCVGSEHHELGALMLALFLRRAGLRVSYLGANLDPTSLVSLAGEWQPAAICLSVTMPEHVAPALELVDALARLPVARIVLGGQGSWPAEVQARSGQILALGSDILEAVALLKGLERSL